MLKIVNRIVKTPAKMFLFVLISKTEKETVCKKKYKQIRLKKIFINNVFTVLSVLSTFLVLYN